MSYTPPAGFRAALALYLAPAASAGFRVALAFGPPGDPPDPPDPGQVGALAAATVASWAAGQSVRNGMRVYWGQSAAVLASHRVVWGGATRAQQATGMAWITSPTAAASTASRWGFSADPLATAHRLPWAVVPTQASAIACRWQFGRANAARALWASWTAPPAQGDGVAAIWNGLPGQVRRPSLAPWNAPPRLHQLFRLRWGSGRGLEWVVRPPIAPPLPVAPLPIDGRRVGVVFACREYAHPSNQIPLRFGAPACYAARPKQRAYIVLNEIQVVRLPDRLPINVDAVSIGLVRDGWCWDARLSLADPSQLSQLSPTVDGLRQVEITINGYPWVVSIETFDKGEVFGGQEVTLSGRSTTALLAEPYAPQRTSETTATRTMVQLATAEVEGSGIALEYEAVDWLVTGGAWYYDGLTPMAALLRLAEASGAVLQSHPALPVVQIRPRFPVSPWLWTTSAPDVVIQDDIVTGTRLQVQSRPLHDAVIVAGERVGVAARVRLSGTAGQTYAPQQIDQLITHADAARERARNVLSDRGGQASVEHDLPLFSTPLQPGQPGLVLPLMLAKRITVEGNWHGVVTGVRIDARREGKAIDIVQTVTLERHYTDAD